MNITTAIHQPHYFPWIPYMNKVASVDIFIIYDTVQLPRGKSKVLRAKYLTEQGEKWLTIPFGKKGGCEAIGDIQLNNLSWKKTHMEKLRNAYRTAPYYEWAMEVVSECLEFDESLSLVDIEQGILEKLSYTLDIRTMFIRASEIMEYRGVTLQGYVVGLLEEVGATVYLSGKGQGSEKTIDESLFTEKNIRLEYQDYHIPTYRQLWTEGFEPSVSVLDALFILGPDARKCICGGEVK